MKPLRSFFAFVQLGRPHFLFGGVLLHALGVTMALYDGAKLHLDALIWGQIAITATQWMTHYANDYFDYEADRANPTPSLWAGGSRVLVEGRLFPRTALNTALVLTGIALVADLALSLWVRPGLLTLGLLLTAQALAWCYSAPPICLHSRGIGEISASLTVAFLVPLTGFYLQAGTLTALPIVTVLPLCCLQFAMLLSVEFPDVEGDALAGKRTLVVRLGRRNAARLYVLVIMLAYAMLPLLLRVGLPGTGAAAFASLSPLALWLVWRVSRGDWQNPRRWNGLAFFTIVLLMATALLEAIAFAALAA